VATDFASTRVAVRNPVRYGAAARRAGRSGRRRGSIVWVTMSDERALSVADPSGPPVRAAEYDAICDALMETSRGRWFLSEYARRVRHAETAEVLAAIGRIEAAMSAERAERTARAEQERQTPAIESLRGEFTAMAEAIARLETGFAALGREPERRTGASHPQDVAALMRELGGRLDAMITLLSRADRTASEPDHAEGGTAEAGEAEVLIETPASLEAAVAAEAREPETAAEALAEEATSDRTDEPMIAAPEAEAAGAMQAGAAAQEAPLGAMPEGAGCAAPAKADEAAPFTLELELPVPQPAAAERPAGFSIIEPMDLDLEFEPPEARPPAGLAEALHAAPQPPSLREALGEVMVLSPASGMSEAPAALPAAATPAATDSLAPLAALSEDEIIALFT
jgi:hypothetical protein